MVSARPGILRPAGQVPICGKNCNMIFSYTIFKVKVTVKDHKKLESKYDFLLFRLN